jgi:hypothetical protein
LNVIRDDEVDLAIDSDNNDGYLPPNRAPAEQSIEDDATKPGKIISVNDDDTDGDGVPDSQDFNGIADEQFVPLIVNIPIGYNPATAKIKLTYNASDPADPNASGALRVWLKPGDAARNTASVSSGGDFLATGASYSPTSCGYNSYTGHAMTLYVEGIAPTTTEAARLITLSVDLLGTGNFAATDAVYVTAYPGLIRVDANRDGTINFNPADSSQSDRTSAKLPYRFWLNDNNDYYNQDGTDNNGVADWSERSLGEKGFTIDSTTNLINNARDVQDFSRVVIQTPPGLDPQGTGWQMKLTLNAISGALAIKLVYVNKQTADTYLTTQTVAQQLAGARLDYSLQPGELLSNVVDET